MKKKEDAATALQAAEKSKKSAQAAVERLLNSVDSSTKNTDSKAMSTLLSKLGVSRDVNEEKATDQSKKLFKHLQKCEEDTKNAQENVEETSATFTRKIPTFMRDLELVESNRQSSLRSIMKELVDAYLISKQQMVESSQRLKRDIESGGEGGFEAMVQEGEKKLTEGDASDSAMKLSITEMMQDGICALTASKPSALPSKSNAALKEASVAGKIPPESTVWLNAFMGRIYRDASSSFKFIQQQEALMTSTMNKGKKPSYIGKFKVSGLKLGEVGFVVKNATYVRERSEHISLTSSICNYPVLTLASFLSHQPSRAN